MQCQPVTRATVSHRYLLEWGLPLLLILLYWGTRLPALTALPLHNDEGLHLTRAVEVWNLHSFREISDGKIINHWLIALLYPQHEPVFIGTLGLAAGYTLARRLADHPADCRG